MCKAISYQRFSSDPQEKGRSLARQQGEFERACTRKGWTPEADSIIDEAKSGFHGDHIKKGNLGAFVDLLKTPEGKKLKGKVLVVEDLSRFGRQPFDETYDLVRKILKAGLEIYSCKDPELHVTKESLREPMTIMGLAIASYNAWQHSLVKQRYAFDDARAKQEQARKGKIWTSKGPSWLELSEDRSKWIKIPEKVATVKLIFNLCIKGLGVQAIANKLVADGVEPLNGKSWNRTHIRNLLRSRVVRGEYQPTTGKERKPVGDPISNYYGKGIIDKTTWQRAQRALSKRARSRGGSEKKWVNFLKGLLKDKETGSTLYVTQRAGNPTKRIYPAASVNGKGGYWSAPLDFVERAVLASVSEVDLSKEQTEQEIELEGQRAKIEDLNERIAQAKEALDTHPDLSAAFEKLSQWETDRKATEATIEQLEASLTEKPQDRLQAARSAVKALQEDNSDKRRVALRAKLGTIIDRIQVSKCEPFWNKGAKGLTIDVHYRSEPVARTIMVDMKRKTYINLRADLDEDADGHGYGDAAMALEQACQLPKI